MHRMVANWKNPRIMDMVDFYYLFNYLFTAVQGNIRPDSKSHRGGCTPQEALLLGLLILDRQVEFKLSWKLILRVQSVGEIHPPYPTVSMNLYT